MLRPFYVQFVFKLYPCVMLNSHMSNCGHGDVTSGDIVWKVVPFNYD